MSRLVRCAAPAIALASIILVPFFHKAFTIDDTLFLRQAEHLLADPLHPTAFEIVWTETPAPLRMSEIMVSGPSMAYLLVPTILADGAEWVAHLTQLILFALALAGTVSLALRLGASDWWAGAAAMLLASTPAALGLAGTAMPDIAAMAFAVAGLDRFVAWRETRGWRAAALGAIFLALGALARSHVLLLLPIAALLAPGDGFGWNYWRRTALAAWLPILAVPVITTTVSMIVRDPAGPATVAAATLRYSGPAFVGPNLVAFATHWSFVLPLAVPWLALRWRALARAPMLYLATAAAAYLLIDQQPGSRLVWIAPAAGLAAAVLVDILVDAWKRHDSIQLVLGMALFAAVPVALYNQLPSKYLLVSAPAAAVLVARAMNRHTWPAVRRALAISVVAGGLLGVLILQADAAFADLGRRAARELIAPQVASGKTVWFAGHWGFQWYAERAGARCLTLRGPKPQAGDLAVSSQVALGGIIQVFEPRALVSVIEDERPGGRIMTRRDGAGFYSNAWGYFPWVWSDDALDRYTLWRRD